MNSYLGPWARRPSAFDVRGKRPRDDPIVIVAASCGSHFWAVLIAVVPRTLKHSVVLLVWLVPT